MIKMMLVPLVLHFIADFLLQSREMGKKKSSEWRWLLKHLAIQFGVMTAGLFPVVLLNIIDKSAYELALQQYPMWMYAVAAFIQAGMFSLLNAVVHGLIDWHIWKLYKLSAYMRIKREAKEINASPEWIAEMGKNWQYWEDHWFYTTIGFDQLLHTATIVVLAVYLL